jgi:hypothetical protein
MTDDENEGLKRTLNETVTRNELWGIVAAFMPALFFFFLIMTAAYTSG